MATSLPFSWTDGPSSAVVAAVASELGIEPTEIGAPLYDFVEPDALDALFAPTYDGVVRAAGYVTFSMHGCTVTVDGRGEVTAERITSSPADRADDFRTPG